LPKTWDAYLKALDRKDRYLINRTERDFAAWAGADHAFHRAEAPAQLAEGKAILRQLHNERWGDGSGTFRSPLFLAFHDQVMAKLLGRGSLELTWLTVRGEPVAAMYCIAWNNKVHFYQCGRRLDVPKAVRPGGVLLYHAIRDAITKGRREFDFLGGEAVYKSQLALASRPLLELRVSRRCVVEYLRQAAQRAKKWIRPLLRRREQNNTDLSTVA
jgi:CelD/BcsL family acetyltransferase involved in cellulose biosynthesis